MTASLEKLSVREIADTVRRGDFSSAETLEYFGSNTRGRDSQIRAFRSFDADAHTVGDAGETGLLAGVPVAIKDGICSTEFPTTACSKMLSEFRSPGDATVVAKLREAGATIVGTTNMDEFAMGSSTENSAFATTTNPWDTNRVPGGSSGGSAAAVAASMVPLALGSDTGGSIRQPAAFCGVTGLKPTWGRVSRLGLIAFASSLDQIGPIARSAEDAAIMMSVIAGHDPADSTSADVAVEDYVADLDRELAGLRIGVCESQLTDQVQPEILDAVRTAASEFEKLGASLTPIEMPIQRYAAAAYYVVAPCEASSNLARYDGVRYTARSDQTNLGQMYTVTRSENFGDEVKRRILLGTYALSSGYYDQYYVKASRARRLIRDEYQQNFESVDLILGPTTPTVAFPIGEKANDPIQMYLADVFTVSANLAGVPAISIPCGFADGMPIGLQLQGPSFSESRLLNAAHQYQQRTDWHQRRPT